MPGDQDKLQLAAPWKLLKGKTDIFWSATALAALAAVLLLAFTNWLGVERANRSAAEARERVSQLRRVLRLLDDAETGQRGYLLTGDPAYLEPYNASARELPPEMAKVREQFASGENRQASEQLANAVRTKISELSETVELQRTKGSAAALALVRTDRGKNAMDQVRQLIDVLEQEVTAEADMRSREVARRARDGALVTSAACITLFILLAVANLQLRRQRILAETANQAKSSFLASMSHELRTPLNAIIGYSEMLVEEAEGAEQTAFIADLMKIQSAGRHLLLLINSVLDMSKIEAGKMDLYIESFSVPALVREVSSVAAPLAEKNGNQLEIVIEPSVGSLHTDQTKLRQALYNLLSNACKFTHNGVVRFEVRRLLDSGRETMVFEVTDSGIGITDEQIGKLFRPFSQADSSTTRRFGGTGLGLALSRDFIRMLGGEIAVRSEPGSGSTFTVTIPVSAAPARERSGAGGEVVRVEATSHEDLILAIDDERDVAELLSRTLARYGFRVHPAYNGEEGLLLARKLRPAAITLDVIMPGMDGWSVLATLKADAELSEIPVVMLTIADSRNLGYTLGASDYLTKPIDRDRLAAVLMRYRKTPGVTSALVIEDEADSRALLRRALESEGWKIHEAENGRVALEHIAATRPGIILLDLMMPEMDGFEFVSAVRKMPEGKGIPIIVITAKDITVEDRQRLNGNVSRILQKGAFQIPELLAEVSQLVVRRVRMQPPGEK